MIETGICYMSQHKIRCLPGPFLISVVNSTFLKNRSLFFFKQNNELFWNRWTELSEMTHQLCSVSVALCVYTYIQKATRESSKEQPICWELITLGYSWRNTVFVYNTNSYQLLSLLGKMNGFVKVILKVSFAKSIFKLLTPRTV